MCDLFYNKIKERNTRVDLVAPKRKYDVKVT